MAADHNLIYLKTQMSAYLTYGDEPDAPLCLLHRCACSCGWRDRDWHATKSAAHAYAERHRTVVAA